MGGTAEGKGAGDGLVGAHGSTSSSAIAERDELEPGKGADLHPAAPATISSSSSTRRRPRRTANDVCSEGPGRDEALLSLRRLPSSPRRQVNDGVQDERDNLEVERVTIQSKVINDEIPTNYGPGHDVLEGGGGDEVLQTKRGRTS